MSESFFILSGTIRLFGGKRWIDAAHGDHPYAPVGGLHAFRNESGQPVSITEGEAMFAVVYRWRLKPGREEQFADGWARVTRAIHESCGSYGSRLHRCQDGTWLAYARWPDAATRDACEYMEAVGRRLMRDAVEEDFEEMKLTVVDDLLREPE